MACYVFDRGPRYSAAAQSLRPFFSRRGTGEVVFMSCSQAAVSVKLMKKPRRDWVERG